MGAGKEASKRGGGGWFRAMAWACDVSAANKLVMSKELAAEAALVTLSSSDRLTRPAGKVEWGR
jgi:hypothetical protein